MPHSGRYRLARWVTQALVSCLVLLLPVLSHRPTLAAGGLCSPLQVPIPPLRHVSTHDVPVPSVEDGSGHALDRFYEKLARAARKQPGSLVRIGIYGDSNMTADQPSGAIRRRLQRQFGDGGHGFVGFGKPYPWYLHSNVVHGQSGRWSSYNLNTRRGKDRLHGFAGIYAESNTPGATVWAGTIGGKASVGKKVSSFDVYYLQRPGAGSFEVIIDGKPVQTIETGAVTTAEAGFARFEVPDGPHRLTARVKSGKVRLYGVVLERQGPGVVVDCLGSASLNVGQLAGMNQPLAAAGLKHRNYDLILETTGTNMWAPNMHGKWMARVVSTWRTALPGVSIMLWTPPDHAQKKPEGWKPEPRMKACAKEKLWLARKHGLALWDLYGALGGFGSMMQWHREHWEEGDYVHLGPRLSEYAAERFVQALLEAFNRRLIQNPQLGC